MTDLWSAGGSILGSLAGSWLTSYSNEKAAERNEAFQREMAQNGLSWRVADAKRAGINPLVALGASTYNASPTHVGTDYGDLGLGAAGQSISRAMSSKMTKEQREMHELNKKLLEVKIEGQSIDNNNARNIGTGPPLPTPDYTGSAQDVVKNGVQVKPAEVITAKQRGVQAGNHALYTDAIDDNGYLWRVPSQDFADVLESSFPTWVRHNMAEGKKILKSWSQIISTPERRSKFANELRKVRPPSPRSGWEFRWDLNKAAWKLVQKEDGGTRTRIYLHDLNPSEKRYTFPKRR